MIPKADFLSGFNPHQDSIANEKRLAATIISKAWKDALLGDKGAFSFATSPDSLFAFWCGVCGLEVQAARSCFVRLQEGKFPNTPDPLTFHNIFHNKLTVVDIRRAVHLFTLLRPSARDRVEVFTWISVDMEKSYEAVKEMFFSLARKVQRGENGHNPALIGLEKEFKEVWNGG